MSASFATLRALRVSTSLGMQEVLAFNLGASHLIQVAKVLNTGILCNMTHRGGLFKINLAVGADIRDGDGAGTLSLIRRHDVHSS